MENINDRDLALGSTFTVIGALGIIAIGILYLVKKNKMEPVRYIKWVIVLLVSSVILLLFGILFLVSVIKIT